MDITDLKSMPNVNVSEHAEDNFVINAVDKDLMLQVVKKNAKYYWLIKIIYGTDQRFITRFKGLGGYSYKIKNEEAGEEYRIVEHKKFSTPLLLSIEEIKQIIENPEQFINGLLEELKNKIKVEDNAEPTRVVGE